MKKKLLIVLTFGVLLLGLGACDGDETGGGGGGETNGGGGGERYCYTCVHTITWVGASASTKEPTTTTIEQCNLTEEDVRTLEKNETRTIMSSSGDIGQSIVLQCTRK